MASSSDAPVDVSAVDQDDKTYTVSSKDVSLMLSVVNVVSARGGFKPNEFKLVGDLIFKVIDGLSKNKEDNSKIEKEVQKEIIDLCSSFPIYGK